MQLLAGMSWQIQEDVNVGHSGSLRTISNFYNVIACANFSLLQHAKVEPWSVMCHEQGCHPRFIHANADPKARHAWLRYFKYRTTNAVSIADADLIIRKSLNSEVLSELAEGKVITSEKAFPIVIRVHLINKNGALLPTVAREIGLSVTIDIELAHHSPSRNRGFPDCGSDSFSVPCYVARQTDIYREQSGHSYLVESSARLESFYLRASGQLCPVNFQETGNQFASVAKQCVHSSMSRRTVVGVTARRFNIVSGLPTTSRSGAIHVENLSVT